jgi:hypothetical protein
MVREIAPGVFQKSRTNALSHKASRNVTSRSSLNNGLDPSCEHSLRTVADRFVVNAVLQLSARYAIFLADSTDAGASCRPILGM